MKGTEYNGAPWLPEPTAWDNLSMKSKADIIGIGFRHGLSSIEDIKTAYNRTIAGEDIYGKGGLAHPSIKRARLDAFDRFLANGRVENRYDGISEDTQQMNAPNIFRRPDGTYFYQSPEGEEVVVTPIMTTLGDESMWTYQDESGRRYTPRYSTGEGSIVQGETPSTWDRIIAASNRNYFDPVLGAPARWKASWENNTNPIKAVWDNPAITGHPLGMAAKAAEYLLSEEGLKKTKRLYDNWDGSDTSTYYLTRSLAGDALAGLGLLPAVSQGYKTGRQFVQDNYLGAFGKPVVSENYSVLSPTIRTKVGDVEINNPGLNYRVGTQDIVDDFVSTGIVRAGETNHQKAGKAGRFLLTKVTFTNPMFKEGSLWYQPSEEMSGLLVTSEPMQWATKSSAPLANDGIFTIQGKTFANDMGGRRIPYEGQVLDASNTTAYTYDPSYGYRRVFLKGTPAAEWAESGSLHSINNSVIEASGAAEQVPDYKFIGFSLADAKKYKASDGYKALAEKAGKESEEMGTGFFPPETFTTVNEEIPRITFGPRAAGDKGGYDRVNNVIDIDLEQSAGYEVPFHEGLHWQSVGIPNIEIGPNYQKYLDAVAKDAPVGIRNTLLQTFRQTPEKERLAYRENAMAYLREKTDAALSEDYPIQGYMRNPEELQANGTETGKALGIEPFAPYPGYEEAKAIVPKAREYNENLRHVKADTPEEVENFWKIITGNYIPTVIGGVLVNELIEE